MVYAHGLRRRNTSGGHSGRSLLHEYIDTYIYIAENSYALVRRHPSHSPPHFPT